MRIFSSPGKSAVYASNAMVATSHPLAAYEALNIMRDGGNALDAAIAGAVLLGACEPHMTGIGGDCFALIKPAGTNEVTAINGSGRAPNAIDAAALRGDGLERIEAGHAASITVPGAIRAFCDMSEKYGRAGIDRILAPAIDHFEAGVPIAPRVSYDLAGIPQSNLNGSAQKYFTQGSKAMSLGHVFRAPGQSEVLRRIARDGASGFYEGEVAEDMLAALSSIGGVHSASDFANTATTFDTPCSGHYRGTELIEHPPNGQGAIAILICQILAEFDLASLDPHGAERLHLEIEATKLAYDARNRFLSDPDYMTALDHLLDQATAKSLAGLIDRNTAMADAAPLSEDVHKDTVLITTVDRDGMAVSLIYSIFASLGSGVATDKFGILFHNRGSGFNLTPGHPNEIGPNKRPMHTIIPAMTRTGQNIDMAFGVMGGQYQATGHAHVISNMIDFGMDPQSAIDATRVFPEPDGLRVETSMLETTRRDLEAKGHKLNVRDEPIGGAQAIQIDHKQGVLIGASDPRKDGMAVGY